MDGNIKILQLDPDPVPENDPRLAMAALVADRAFLTSDASLTPARRMGFVVRTLLAHLDAERAILAHDAEPLNTLAEAIHTNAERHGFWDGERNFGEQIALIHSELSEALEEHRDGKADLYLVHGNYCSLSVSAAFGVGVFIGDRTCTCDGGPKPEGVAVELVDALIRILDTLASLDTLHTIDEVVEIKMKYNASRPFKHGKAY